MEFVHVHGSIISGVMGTWVQGLFGLRRVTLRETRSVNHEPVTGDSSCQKLSCNKWVAILWSMYSNLGLRSIVRINSSKSNGRKLGPFKRGLIFFEGRCPIFARTRNPWSVGGDL